MVHRKLDESRKVVGGDLDIFDFWFIGGACVAGSSVHGRYGRRSREFPAQGVLTAPAAYDEDIHVEIEMEMEMD
jgi:hypothetical protein